MTPLVDRLTARRLGSAAADALNFFRRPRMDRDVAYALFPPVAERPQIQPSLRALAAQIHRERRGAEIELVDGDQLQMQDAGAPLKVVSIYVLESGYRTRLIGHAWLDGQGRAALMSELRRQRPDRTQHLVAA